MPYLATKTYGHSLGLSATFRQHRADSHCKFIHGYSLSFKLIFGCTELDGRNWVLDFGGLKSVKQFLSDTFDHKMLVAEDDPYLEELLELNDVGLAQVITVPAVGCEGFAKLVFDFVEKVLDAEGHVPRVWLHSAECREHEGNSAIYEREYPEGT